MHLLANGYETVPSTWHVCERTAPGFVRCYYVEAGMVTYSGATGKAVLEHGALYVFPSASPYTMTQDCHRPLRCLWFHFDVFPALVERIQCIQVEPHSTLFYLLEALRAEFAENKTETSVATAMLQGLETILQHKKCLSFVREPVNQCLQFIHANLAQPDLSVGQLALQAGWTQEHFIRMFTQAVGVTPYQYILGRRMQAACRLLLTHMSVTQTARSVGYENARVFSHAFQNHFGITPGKFAQCYYPVV